MGLFDRFKPAKQKGRVQARDLLPRLRTADFARSLQEQGVPQAHWPPLSPVCGELWVSYGFDTGDEYVMATPEHLREAGVAAADVSSLALENLTQRVNKLPWRTVEDNGGYVNRLGAEGFFSGLEASCILWPELRLQMREVIPRKGPLLAAVPTRDHLFLVDGANSEALGYASQVVEQFMAREGRHGLSSQWMEFGEDGLSLWREAPLRS